MQRKRCHYYKIIAGLLCLLLFLGILGFLSHKALREKVNPGGEKDNPGDEKDNPGEEGDHPGVTQGPPGGVLTPGPYPYIINEPNKCPEGEPPPFLVFLILTEADDVEARNAIRQTWGNEDVAPGLGVIRLFLLGVKEGEPGRRQQKTLESESLVHHDILQQNFSDTYHNLTIKTVMGMNWVAVHCPRASYVMKADSDVLVNTDYLIHKLLRPELELKTNYITGCIMRGTGPIRDKRNWKYYMPREEYPGKVYPTYLSGPGYVFSGDMVTKLYRASLSSRLLRFEDVYVGVCLERLGIEPTPSPNGLFNHWGLSYSSSRYSNMVTVHKVYPSQLLEYWHKMQSNKLYALHA